MRPLNARVCRFRHRRTTQAFYTINKELSSVESGFLTFSSFNDPCASSPSFFGFFKYLHETLKRCRGFYFPFFEHAFCRTAVRHVHCYFHNGSPELHDFQYDLICAVRISLVIAYILLLSFESQSLLLGFLRDLFSKTRGHFLKKCARQVLPSEVST